MPAEDSCERNAGILYAVGICRPCVVVEGEDDDFRPFLDAGIIGLPQDGKVRREFKPLQSRGLDVAFESCPDRADDADLVSLGLDDGVVFYPLRPFVRRLFDQVSAKEGEVGDLLIVLDLLDAPIELMVSQGHGDEREFVHEPRRGLPLVIA